jgi:hypothetical protein
MVSRRALGSFEKSFGVLQFFSGVAAHRLGAGFGLSGMLFHFGKDFSRWSTRSSAFPWPGLL